MQNSLQMRILVIVALNCLFMISLNGQGLEGGRPMNCVFSLSGNFGELRATHFHAGIDIRTGGVTGVPVLSVKDGQVVRVRVSPVGYGQALYVEHPDGTTSVYGHLSRFAPSVEQAVRRLHYERQSFDIDEDLRTAGLVVKKGDTIAFSGNTGSSGGPHLHFEVRDTKSEKTINPLRFYKIRDWIPPKAKMIYVYGISEMGCVEMIRQVPLTLVKPGKYSGGTVAVPAGKIGVAVFAEDYMENSASKLGVYKISMVAGGKTLFKMKVDSCSFEQSSFINEMKDFHCYKKRETVYRCFGNYQCQVVCVENRNCGRIHVARDSSVSVLVELADINGNNSDVELILKGGRENAERDVAGDILAYDRSHLLEMPGCRVKIDSGTLFSSVKRVLNVQKDPVTGRAVFQLAETDVPLLKKAELTLLGNFSDKTVVCELDAQGRKYPLATSRNSEGIGAAIGCLNRYTTAEDVKAPVVNYLGVSPDKRLRFKIKDDLTGIAEYRGEVNGEWCLFVYDAKSDLFSCSLREPAFRKGQTNVVKVLVADRVGNRKELVVNVKI